MVNLVLQEMPTYQQLDAILDGRLDLGFVRPLQPKPSSIQSIELCRERLMAVMRFDHALAAGAGEISLRELANEPLVLYARSIGSGLYQKIVDLCRDAGFAPNVAQEANATPTMMGLVAAGIGISILPASLERLSFKGLSFMPLVGTKGANGGLARQARRRPFDIGTSSVSGCGTLAAARSRRAPVDQQSKARRRK